MEKVVLCVGMNDLRDGNSDRQVTDDMKRLIKETQKKHPGCKTYVCSILPIKCTEELKERIKRTNSQFAHLVTSTNNVYYVDILTEFISHKHAHKSMQEQLFEKDHIHPNLKGTVIMTACIRNCLLHKHSPRKEFVSKHADTSNMSYAKSLSARPDQPTRDTAKAKLPAKDLQSKPAKPEAEAAQRQSSYQPRPFPSNLWWPPRHCYPPMMPFFPPGMSAAYAQMYPPGREVRQPQRVNY